MVTFSVHIIQFVLERSFYPHMHTIYTTNSTGEASDFEQAFLVEGNLMKLSTLLERACVTRRTTRLTVDLS